MVETYQQSQSQFFIRTPFSDGGNAASHSAFYYRDHATASIAASHQAAEKCAERSKNDFPDDSIRNVTPDLCRRPQLQQQKSTLSAEITKGYSVPASEGGCSGNIRGLPFIRKDLKFYNIVVTNDLTNTKYFIMRRFNDFHSLAQQLRRDFPNLNLPMPEKERIQTAINTIRQTALKTPAESEMMSRRMNRLNEFVQYITKDPNLMAHPMVIEFFGPGYEKNKKKLSNDSLSSDDINGTARSGGGSVSDGVADSSLTSSLRSASPASLLLPADEAALSLGPTEQQQMRPDDFQFLKTIGRGNFGRVFQAILTRTNDVYAVKVLDKSRVSLTERDRNHVMTERNILVINLNHPFLVCLRFSFQTKTKLYFVMDYVNGGELFYHLQKSGFFSEELSCFYSAEIASALGYLHSKKIIYRDLKPENLLLDAEGHIKLTDFGLCKTFISGGKNNSPRTRTYCGTPEYLAPEMIRHESYGFEVDWWCLGAVTYEMVFSLPPWYSKDHQRMHIDILNQPLELDRRDRRVSSSCKKFLRELLVRSPSERLGSHGDFADIKQHAFFANIDWVELDARRIRPPFVPRVLSKYDLTNIDPCFQNEAITESVVTTSGGGGRKTDSGYCGDYTGRNNNTNIKHAVGRQQNPQHQGGFSVSVREAGDDTFEGFSYVAPFPANESHDQDN